MTDSIARDLVKVHGTPLYVYSRQKLQEQARQILAIDAPYGHTIRYAMKANPHPDILKTLHSEGIAIDASSEYEVQQALDAGFEPSDILLTSQQLAQDLEGMAKKGVQFNACSLHQLEAYGKLFPGTGVSVRINPGIGSGHSAKTKVGGPTSSFGIWYEYIPDVLKLAKKYQLTIHRMHTQIGAGAEQQVWLEAAQTSLGLIRQFPAATILNLGGGFKVACMAGERGVDMAQVGEAVAKELRHFQQETGRELHLELEPGTFMAANVGVLVARVDDIVDTGKDGYTFLKLDTGMNDILRPSLYGAQHPIWLVGGSQERTDYVIVGHNCESGDLLTPGPGNPEVLAPRTLPKAKIGDIVCIGGAGAYCASMATHGYNSFPDAKEVMLQD